MKLSINDKVIKILEEWEIKLLQNDIRADKFEAEMKRRVEWVWQHKIDQCFERLMKEWVDKLRADPSVSSLPLDRKDFVEMVTARSDYKDRMTRDIQ